MANKNVYFFQVDLFRSGEQLNYQEIGNIFKEIINKHAVDFGKYKSLDATPYEEEMHLMIDIYEYEDNLFLLECQNKSQVIPWFSMIIELIKRKMFFQEIMKMKEVLNNILLV